MPIVRNVRKITQGFKWRFLSSHREIRRLHFLISRKCIRKYIKKGGTWSRYGVEEQKIENRLCFKIIFILLKLLFKDNTNDEYLRKGRRYDV